MRSGLPEWLTNPVVAAYTATSDKSPHYASTLREKIGNSDSNKVFISIGKLKEIISTEDSDDVALDQFLEILTSNVGTSTISSGATIFRQSDLIEFLEKNYAV